MIYHQVENINDKQFDYNVLLETPYYYQPSPTLSTPLSSPTYSLIQDDQFMPPHQEIQTPPSVMAMGCYPPQENLNYANNNNNTNDWQLDPFYDLNSFNYNPLVVPPMTYPSFDPMITMMMTAEAPVNDPVPHVDTNPPTHTQEPASKKKSCKRKSVPYANQMRNLNFSHLPPSPVNKVSPPPPTTKKTKPSSPYKCDVPGCDKSFTRPYNLKSHRRTHTNEKPFECPHCSKTFARQHDRNRHAKLHLGVKPFFCFLCFKCFARQDALSRHQRMSEDGEIGCSTLKRKKATPSA
ncbi:hypothetical protein BC941DRAFT_437604 [Chlamydoabsidia padenii]|nr:hypothetical protein BC941DRAFT_437604 [Chlamydoabsidia padenii]